LENSKKKITKTTPSLKKTVKASNKKHPSEIEENVTKESYEQVLRKIHLQSEFIFRKIPASIVKVFTRSLYKYLRGNISGSSFRVWPSSLFLEGTQKLRYPLHLVILAPQGREAFSKAFPGLPFSLRGAGLPKSGCASSFLASEEDINNYFNGRPIKKALNLDLKIPIQRVTKEKESLEFLNHQKADIRDYTLFLIFDNKELTFTRYICEQFPLHPVITHIKGNGFPLNEPEKAFENLQKTLPASIRKDSLYKRVLFLPDISSFYTKDSFLKEGGHIFGTVAAISKIAPEYSKRDWGAAGGSEGILKVVQARYGNKSNYSKEEIAHALRWAEKNNSTRF
jgi:hypothetical protein